MKKYVKIAFLTLSMLTVRLQNYAQSVSNTGQTSIAVPIHTVQDGSAVVPIALSYDHSGVKPDVHPGWVGQNWNLAAGGMITRVVRDIPDDFDADIYTSSPKPVPGTCSPTFESTMPMKRRILGLASHTTDTAPAGSTSSGCNCVDPGAVDYLNWFFLHNRDTLRDNYFNKNTAWNDNSKFKKLIDGVYDRGGQSIQKVLDSESDMYMFSLPNGVSGKFYFDAYSRQFHFQGNKTFKVEILGANTKPPFHLLDKYNSGIGRTRFENGCAPFSGQIYSDEVPKTVFAEKGATYSVTSYSKSFNGFVLTTDDGTRYEFGNDSTSIDYSMNMFYQEHSQWIANAWYLKSIQTPDNRIIKFTYDELIEKTSSGKIVGGPFSTSMYMNASFRKSTFSTEPYIDNTMDFKKNGIFAGNLIRSVYIKSIVSKRDSIVFIKSRSVELEYPNHVYRKNFNFWYNNTYQVDKPFDLGNPLTFELAVQASHPNRPWSPYTYDKTLCVQCSTTDTLDWFTSKIAYPKLDTIIVYNTLKQKIKTFVLDYNNSGIKYTYSAIAGGKTQRQGSFNERLRLKAVRQIAPSSADIKTMFAYAGHDGEPGTALPNLYLDSLGKVDHWGFYNGVSFDLQNKTSLRDLVNHRYYQPNAQTAAVEQLTDLYYPFRNPLSTITNSANSTVVQSSILKSITLPTCGKTVYTYEQHDYSYRLLIDTSYAVSYSYPVNPSPLTTISLRKVDFKQRVLPVASMTNSGGLRIAAITNYDENSNIVSSKTFSYKENYSNGATLTKSSGILDGRFSYYSAFAPPESSIWTSTTSWVTSGTGFTPNYFDAAIKAVYKPITLAEYIVEESPPAGIFCGTSLRSCLLFPDVSPGEAQYQQTQYLTTWTSTNMGGSFPVLYSEITEIDADGGYIVNKFTNFNSIEGGQHFDEYNTGVNRWNAYFTNDEPYSDKSFERGLLNSQTVYKSNNTLISKSVNTYGKINGGISYGSNSEDFVKSIYMNSGYVKSVDDPSLPAVVGNIIIGAAFNYFFAPVATVFSVLGGEVKPFRVEYNCHYYINTVYPYKNYTYMYGLQKTIATTYNPNSQTQFVVDSIYYTYNKFYQPSEIRKRLSNGTIFLTRMKYAADYADGVIPQTRDGLSFNYRTSGLYDFFNYFGCNNQAGCNATTVYQTQVWPKPELEALICMAVTNKISAPVETQILRNGKTIGGTLNFYRHKLGQVVQGLGEFDGLDALEKTFKMKLTPTLAAVTPSTINKANWTFTYDATRFNVKAFQVETGTTPFSTTTGNPFIGYDSKGNLLSITDRSGLNAKMTYDANYLMTSRYVAGTLGEEAITKTQYVTTPLIGVKEITDPNGKKIRYEYDGFNRIKAVKQVYSDGKEYLLKTYAYHYCSDGSTGAVTIGNFVNGGCDITGNPIDCKLSATVIPTSAMEKGQPVTLVASFDEGASSTSSAGQQVSYLWQLPDGTTQTNSTLTQPTPLLGDYVLTVEKGKCKTCLRFTVSATSLSLVEDN